MKAKDACKHFDISFPTLRTWAKSGKIPFEVLPSGRINYLPSVEFLTKEQKRRDDNAQN